MCLALNPRIAFKTKKNEKYNNYYLLYAGFWAASCLCSDWYESHW